MFWAGASALLANACAKGSHAPLSAPRFRQRLLGFVRLLVLNYLIQKPNKYLLLCLQFAVAWNLDPCRIGESRPRSLLPVPGEGALNQPCVKSYLAFDNKLKLKTETERTS
jgi:hypothetical protein